MNTAHELSHTLVVPEFHHLHRETDILAYVQLLKHAQMEHNLLKKIISTLSSFDIQTCLMHVHYFAVDMGCSYYRQSPDYNIIKPQAFTQVYFKCILSI